MIDIVIPMLWRTHNIQPLLESISCTQVPYRVMFVTSPGDDETIAVCQATGHKTWTVSWTPDSGDWAKKINWAIGILDGEWIFTGADDIRFHPGWDTAALRDGQRVVGTNDLHNPSVKAGRHATHFLIARSYIEEYGGEIFCEEYDHWFVDNEFVDIAKRRGEWGFAVDSIVEHLHPHWGLAEDDDTYRKGTRAVQADAALYRSRRRARR